MVDYDPRRGRLTVNDTTEEENLKLKRALDILFTMITGGRNLSDISMVASKLAEDVQWPNQETRPRDVMMRKWTGEEE